MKKFRFLFLILINLTIFFVSQANANINNLKDTSTILIDDYKHLSIINGAIAEQFDYIMHLYDYGCLGETKTVKYHEADTLVPDPKNASAVIKLVHVFFHRPPGTTGRGDFAVIQVLRDEPDKKALAKAFGFLVGFIGADGFNRNIGTKKDLFIKNIQELSGNPIQAVQQGGAQKHVDIFKRLAEFDAIKIDNVLKPSAKLSPEDKQNKVALTTFLLPILRAMQDDNSIKKQDKEPEPKVEPSFPPDTTLNVLQAIVFKLFGDDKALLKEFYEKANEVVNKLSGKQIFRSDLPDFFETKDGLINLKEEWVDQKFDPAQKETYTAQAKALENASPEKLVEKFETLVYVALMPGDYPRHEGMDTTFYEYDEIDKTKNVSFSDCMDNTVRNMVNNLVYDKATLSLKTDILKKRIKEQTKQSDISFDPKLEDFYFEYSSATNTGGPAHNAWAKVISNIPGVAYNRHTNYPRDVMYLTGCGYIRNTSGINEDFLVKHNYRVIKDEKDILYEIMPSLRNVIIVFNHFFGLNLFDEEKGDTTAQKFANAFVREDFVEVYFKKMCQKLGIGIDENAWPDIEVDEVDYTTQPINTNLKFNQLANNFDFKLITSNMRHGELFRLKPTDSTKVEINWITNAIQNLPSIYSKLPNHILSAILHIEYAIFHENWKQNFKQLTENKFLITKYDLLYWLPIYNSDFVILFMKDASEQNFIFNLNSLNLLHNLIKKIPDQSLQTTAMIDLKKLIILCSEWKPESGVYGFPELSASSAIQAAFEGMKSDNYSIKYEALILYEGLLKRNQGFEAAIKSASECLKSDNKDVRYLASRLLLSLVENNQGYDQAINAATTWIKSSYNFNSGLALFKALIEKNQGIDTAIKSAIECVKSSKQEIRDSALDLYRALFEKNQGFESATQTAAEYIKSSDMNIRRAALDLYYILVEKNRDIDNAINAAAKCIKSSDDKISNSALLVYQRLVEKNRDIDNAINAAATYIKSSDWNVGPSALRLYEKLIEKNRGIDSAIQAAHDGIKSSTQLFQRNASVLWKALFDYAEKNESWRQKIITTGKAVDKSNPKGLEVIKMAEALEAKFPQSDPIKQDLIKLKAMSMEMKNKFGNLRQGLTNLRTRMIAAAHKK